MNCDTKCPAIRQVMFPKDTNPSGNIFGGIILSHIDVAGAIAARLHSKHRMVTVCMKEVVFKRPVKVGDILTCWTDVVSKGRSSVTVKIKVEAERHGEIIHVTDGEAIYVAVDANDRPIPLDSEPNLDPADTIGPAPQPSAPAAPAEKDDQGKKSKKGKKKDRKGGKKNKKHKKDKKGKK